MQEDYKELIGTTVEILDERGNVTGEITILQVKVVKDMLIVLGDDGKMYDATHLNLNIDSKVKYCKDSLHKLEKSVYDAHNRLISELEKLSKEASKLYGEELAAEICNGAEIEYRTYSREGVPNSDICIRVEDICDRNR